MKKLIILLGVLLSFTILASAARTSICMDITIKKDVPGGKINRTPMLLPIEAYYDDETNQVEVIGDYDKPVEIFVCDEDLDVVAYSSVLNTVLDIPAGYHGLIVVRITSDNWVAVGKTEI